MFVELHARSAFSFLEAAALPEALAERAAALEQPALALLDARRRSTARRASTARRPASESTPLVGAEVTLAEGSRLPLLVESPEGYQNLCRLLTTMKMRASAKDTGRGYARRDRRARGGAGLPHRRRGRARGAGARGRRRPRGARAARPARRRLRPRQCLSPSCSATSAARRRRATSGCAGPAATLGLPLLATNAPRMAERGQRPLLDVLTCIRASHHPRRAGRLLADNSERHLKAGARDGAPLRRLPRRGGQ